MQNSNYLRLPNFPVCFYLIVIKIMVCFTFEKVDQLIRITKLNGRRMFVLTPFLWCPPQHLVQWDAGNPECLLQLVKELIQQYHQYQCQRLRESSRLLFEYDSLLEDPHYRRNMEIYAGCKNSWVSNCLVTLCLGCHAFSKPFLWNSFTKILF